jgi:hypothetical protein
MVSRSMPSGRAANHVPSLGCTRNDESPRLIVEKDKKCPVRKAQMNQNRTVAVGGKGSVTHFDRILRVLVVPDAMHQANRSAFLGKSSSPPSFHGRSN